MIFAKSYQLLHAPFFRTYQNKRLFVIPLQCFFETGSRPVCPDCGRPLTRHGTYTKICEGALPKKLEFQVKKVFCKSAADEFRTDTTLADRISINRLLANKKSTKIRNREFHNLDTRESKREQKISIAVQVQRWRCDSCRRENNKQSTHIELPRFLLGYMQRTRAKFIADLESAIMKNGGRESLIERKKRKVCGKDYIIDTLGYLYWRFLRYFQRTERATPTSYFLFLQNKICYHSVITE